jgi:sigma-B regulation protein RsbU (phosphoserine phosphatase)
VLHSSARQAQLVGDRLGVLTIIGTILFFVALIVCLLVSRGLTKPLMELSRGAKEFGEGNLNYRMKLRRKDEFSNLAQSFNIMAISIQEYMHELERETGKRERLESEFRIASEMQRALLPEAPPIVPGLDIVGWSRPSKEVGGDFYDFLELAPGKIGLVLGDATGKGVPAALLTTQCASALRTLSGQFSDPSELLERTNREFHKRVGATHRFVTLFLMVIDVEKGIARYASAGHPTPLLINSTTGTSRWLEEASGFPLGIVAEAQYDSHEFQLTAGDTVLIFSDGLTDARNHDDVLYGEAHIQTSVESLKEVTVNSVLERTRSDVERYMNGKEAADDMTIVVTKFTGKGSV